MTPEEIIAALEYHNGRFPRAALQQAIAQPDAVTPYLLDALKQAKDDPEALLDEPESMLHIYALYLLAQFRETRAYPLIVGFFSTPGEITLDLTGDVVTEDLGRILASVCGGDIEPIKTLIENRDANEYVRTAALTALLVLYRHKHLSRAEFIDYHRALFTTRLERQPSPIWTPLVIHCSMFSPAELRAEIEDVFRRGWIAPFGIKPEHIEESIAEGTEKALQMMRDSPHYEFIDDTIAEMEHWAGFRQQPPPEAKATVPEKPKPKRKIGRNEPCPCGSGKKYKKCCLLKQ